MKILVTGRAIPQQPDRCTGQQLAEGFREAGHECVFYGCFYGQPLRFLGAKEVQSQDFDLVVVTEMNDGMPGYEPLFSYYRLKDTPRVYWDFDVSYHEARSLGQASKIEYDGYLVGNRYFVEKFEELFEKPATHMPYACSPKIHRKLLDEPKNYVLGFVGQLTEERKRLIEVAKDAAYNTASIHAAEGVFGDDLIKQTNQYRVMFHNNQEACKGLVPGRPWETTGCGTTLLMDRTSYNDFTALLPERFHNDLFVYDNETDIKAWLHTHTVSGNKDMELEIAGDDLMHHVHENHSYKNRAQEILRWATWNKILS